jgi:hypothetical protein
MLSAPPGKDSSTKISPKPFFEPDEKLRVNHSQASSCQVSACTIVYVSLYHALTPFQINLEQDIQILKISLGAEYRKQRKEN